MSAQPVRAFQIPQWIAAFLFAGGLFFALCLLPFVAFLPFISGAWVGWVYCVCGYLIYFTWFWRMRHTPSRFFAALIWLGSFIVNSLPLIFILHEEHWHLPTLHGFHGFDAFTFSWFFGAATFGWWVLASILSVFALIYELLPRRHDA